LKKKIIIALIVVVVVAALFWVANLLVTNLNIVEMLKQFHGG
jgi:hypothetical protein